MLLLCSVLITTQRCFQELQSIKTLFSLVRTKFEMSNSITYIQSPSRPAAMAVAMKPDYMGRLLFFIERLIHKFNHIY